jgi:hypothetical protein
MIPELKTTPEAAKTLGLTHAHLNMLIRDGELGELPTNRVASIRVWRPEDIELLRTRLLEYYRANRKFYAVAARIEQKFTAAAMSGTVNARGLTLETLAKELDVPFAAVKEFVHKRARKNLGYRLRPIGKSSRVMLFSWAQLREWSTKVVGWLDKRYAPALESLQPEVAAPVTQPVAVVETPKPIESPAQSVPVPTQESAPELMSGLSVLEFRKQRYGI